MWDRFANPYNVEAILTHDKRLNETAYKEYSPVYLSANFAMTYILAFSLTTLLLVHTALFHGRRIWKALFRNSLVEEDDIHAKLMLRYRNVPILWYLALFAVFFSMAIASVLVCLHFKTAIASIYPNRWMDIGPRC